MEENLERDAHGAIHGQSTLDTIDPDRRSALMSRIRSKDTQPEIAVRSLLHRMGYRFRLHRKDLPGRPDIVLPRHRKAILVHGCFWHGHECPLGSKPKSNQEYWGAKITVNRARDERNLLRLRDLGWSVLVLWECDIRRSIGLQEVLAAFLSEQSASALAVEARDAMRRLNKI
ncbi:MAG: DNA mismatch endonuclease Vsr [Burkholderiales bacterium]|jgi:DNA mismatch endonuclease, patch repair protein|nr:DNA mismatch endonuclease Vsr [Burkholderiales bacterium]